MNAAGQLDDLPRAVDPRPVLEPRMGNASLPSWAPFAVILAVVSAAMLPMAFMGIPDGFDLTQHMRFAATYHNAILSGHITPGWAANDNFGFGSIGIRYYPPLAYYVLALTRIITGSWYSGFWITSLGWMLLGSAGMYLWVREWTTTGRATVAAVVYVIAPYHTFQIYQAVLYAEFAAAGILPFCFLFLSRMFRRSRWVDVVLFSISFSALILTHIPSTIIASLCMAVYGLLILDWTRFKGVAVKVSAALILSFLATSFHIVKAVSEMGWVLHNSPQYFASGYYDYKRYLFPIFSSSTSTQYVEKMLWHIDLLVILSIALFLPLAVAYVLNRQRKEALGMDGKIHRSVLLTGVFSIFMLSVASTKIWESASLLQKIQFPWRWLIVVTLFGSVAFAVVTTWLICTFGKRAGYPLLLFVLVISLFDITQSIIPSVPLSRSVFEQKVVDMYNEEGCDCWWPIWAKRDAFSQPERLFAGLRNPVIEEWSNESRNFMVPPGEPDKVRVATFFHPHWRATVNGEPVPVESDINGAILIPLPETAANVHLTFEEPPFLSVWKILSLITWLSFAVSLAGFYISTQRRSAPELLN